MIAMRERVARAIYEDRYKPDKNPQWVPWDTLRFLAVETEDGGNGTYLIMLAHAHAALSALETPDEGMAEVGAEASDPWREGDEDARAVWQAMIRKA